MRTIVQGSLAILLFVSLLACHKPPSLLPDTSSRGTSEVEWVPPPETPPRPYSVDSTPISPETGPNLIELVLPVYPDSALDDAIACTARILHHIETDGSATIVRIDWEPPPPHEHLAAFEKSIAEAIASWVYVPAKRLILGETDEGLPTFHEKAIPKAARMLIRFRIEEGVPIVE